LDDEAPRYAGAKAELLAVGAQRGSRHRFVEGADAWAGDLEALDAVRRWMTARLELEWPGRARQNSDFDALARELQEDFAILRRAPPAASELDAGGEAAREAKGDRAIGVSVCLPSGWRPESTYGASFAAIHAPVPDFADDQRAAASMVDSMIERGPYLRFVWTVAADDELDHHPEHGRR